jgi:hypothetical protein
LSSFISVSSTIVAAEAEVSGIDNGEACDWSSCCCGVSGSKDGARVEEGPAEEAEVDGSHSGVESSEGAERLRDDRAERLLQVLSASSSFA